MLFHSMYCAQQQLDGKVEIQSSPEAYRKRNKNLVLTAAWQKGCCARLSLSATKKPLQQIDGQFFHKYSEVKAGRALDVATCYE